MRNANRQRHRSKLPAFLGLGPEKTASSWLYGALAKHPRLGNPLLLRTLRIS